MNDCWLTPKGELIEVSSHNEYASDMLEKELGGLKSLYDFMDKNYFRYPYEVLHDRGWVRVKTYDDRISIVGGCMDLTKPMRNTIDPAMNSVQLSVAKRICEENRTTLHVAINDKRFW